MSKLRVPRFWKFDPQKITRFDMILNNFVNKNNLTYVDLLFTQRVNHSFIKQKKKSWIEYVICHNDNTYITQINISEVNNNLSDHFPIF